LTDKVDNGGACEVTDGHDVSVPANESVTRSYTCTYPDAQATPKPGEHRRGHVAGARALERPGTGRGIRERPREHRFREPGDFSDPALGGNEVGAPAPMSGVAIDLKKVCANPSTCSSYVDVSGAFGGATSQTVGDILTYAASRSNLVVPPGTGQAKGTQELAKDTFDAINNQVAFGA
jgi:hypothetical protein